MADMPPTVWLVVIGIFLILVGVLVTPVLPTLASYSYWFGILLLVVGIVSIVLEALAG